MQVLSWKAVNDDRSTEDSGGWLNDCPGVWTDVHEEGGNTLDGESHEERVHGERDVLHGPIRPPPAPALPVLTFLKQVSQDRASEGGGYLGLVSLVLVHWAG